MNQFKQVLEFLEDLAARYDLQLVKLQQSYALKMKGHGGETILRLQIRSDDEVVIEVPSRGNDGRGYGASRDVPELLWEEKLEEMRALFAAGEPHPDEKAPCGAQEPFRVSEFNEDIRREMSRLVNEMRDLRMTYARP